jgi:hypothetical protein
MARLTKCLATLLTIGILLSVSAQLASANVIYTYVSGNFSQFTESPLIPEVYDNTMFVTAIIEFLEPLPVSPVERHFDPIHWSLSDGLSDYL